MGMAPKLYHTYTKQVTDHPNDAWDLGTTYMLENCYVALHELKLQNKEYHSIVLNTKMYSGSCFLPI